MLSTTPGDDSTGRRWSLREMFFGFAWCAAWFAGLRWLGEWSYAPGGIVFVWTTALAVFLRFRDWPRVVALLGTFLLWTGLSGVCLVLAAPEGELRGWLGAMLLSMICSFGIALLVH